MRIVLIVNMLVLLLMSCNTSGVEKVEPQEKPKQAEVNSVLDGENAVVETKKLNDGLKIDWFSKGEGALLKDGDLVMIDYKVKLKDGSVVDGNHLLKKEALPFLVGFQMQTKGWDIALKELRVGDFARVLIPSPLARGEKGVEGLIPSNADNLLFIRVLEIKKPTRIVAGVKVWLLEENKSNKLKFGEKTQIAFHAMASTPTNPLYMNTFRNNEPFTYKMMDHGLVPGLRNALINAKKSDRMYVLVPASEAYGANGYLDFVKPNEDVFYNVLVMDVTKN